MATSEGIPSSIDIEFLELNDNPYINTSSQFIYTGNCGYGEAVFLTWKTFDYNVGDINRI